MIVEFRENDESQLLKMPYSPGAGNSSKNNGYVPLLSDPTQKSKLHELDGFPELDELVTYLLEPHCVFMSWRIDSGWDVYSLGSFSRSVFAFITIAFRQPGPDDREYFAALVNYFQARSLANRIPDSSRALFLVTKWIEKPGGSDRSGICLDVFVQGFGHSAQESWSAWQKGMSLLLETLKDLNERFR
jgi:hypothetical protein